MAAPVQVSFCATNLNTVSGLPASIASIREIGGHLGVPFEIVVADGPSNDGARAVLEGQARADPSFRLVGHNYRNRGLGRRLAFESSAGRTVVPFDTSIVYAAAYAPLLRRYLDLETDRMLFSEICALSRRAIDAVGGWRDLVGGEDIDLYARIIHRFGVIAYPTARRESQSRPLGSYERQMRYVSGSAFGRFGRMLAVQRDQIIGTDLRVRDLMAFNRRKPTLSRAARWGFFCLATAVARLRPIRPIVPGTTNNYLLFREALLDSILRHDYRELGADLPEPQLLLTPDEVEYLRTSSRSWTRYEQTQPPPYGIK